MCEIGPKFGYFPKAAKSRLIVKVNAENKTKEIFSGRGVQITTNRKLHVVASLESDKYKDEYLASKVNEWVKDLGILLDIAKTQPQAAHSALIARFLHKVTHYMHIEGKATQLRRVEKVIETEFMSSMTGRITCNKDERKLISCPSRLSGLGIPKIAESYQVEFEISVKLTEGLCAKIISQSRQYEAGGKLLAIKMKFD